MSKQGVIGQLTGEAIEITKEVGKGLGEIAAKTGEELVKQVGISPNSEDSQQKQIKSRDIKSLQKKDDKIRGKEIAQERAFLRRIQEEGQSYRVKHTQELQQKAASQAQQVKIEKERNIPQASAQDILAQTGSTNRKPGLGVPGKKTGKTFQMPTPSVENKKWDSKTG